METGELLRKAGALQRKPFDKAKPKVLKFVVPVSMPGVVKEIVAGKCLVEFTSGDHGWFPSTDLISIIEAEQRGLINEQGV